MQPVLPHPQGRNLDPTYRPDIDGLRAVAILAVVIFHAFPSCISGGFVGVDIFFVISGYLISNIIFKSLARGDFSLTEFYVRRIKRIFPALILVLATSLIFGWFFLLPDEFKHLGKHVIASAGFVQNFVLLNESGYFDTASELKPLLHLWSLAIEEQFYVIYPLLILGAWRLRLNILTTAILLGLLSFGLNIESISTDPSDTFFLPQTRFWELLAGAVHAHSQLFERVRHTHWLKRWIFLEAVFRQPLAERANAARNNILSALGLLLIIGAIVGLSRENFPGWWAIAPVLGASLLILGGKEAWINRNFLANRAMVFLGLISYPLYLWHWPLLAFARIVEGHVPSIKIRIALIISSFLLAWLTYRFLEKSFRLTRLWKTQIITLVVMMGAIGGAAYSVYRTDGYPSREGSLGIQLANAGDLGQEDFYRHLRDQYYACTPNKFRNQVMFRDIPRCFQSQDRDTIDIAIIGDSHAEHLFIGLAESLPSKNIVYYIRNREPTMSENSEYNEIFDFVINESSIKTIILSAYWIAHQDNLSQEDSFKTRLKSAVYNLVGVGKKVYVIAGIPQSPNDPRYCSSVSYRSTNQTACQSDRDLFDVRYNTYFQDLKSLELLSTNIKTLDISHYLCDSNFCYIAKNGQLLYRDHHHLNINGSKFIGRKIVEDNQQLLY